MKKYALGVDPGETIGVAVGIIEDGKFTSFARLDQVRHEDFPEYLDDLFGEYEAFEFIVYEKFITYRQYAQRQVGSKQVAAQVIGMIKFFAKMKKIKIVEQGADILAIGYRWMNFKKDGRAHSESHRFDAAAHLMYYMVNKKVAEPIGVESIG